MWSEDVILMILNGVKETLYMTLASTILGYVFGLPMGICLAVSDKDGLKPNAVLYKISKSRKFTKFNVPVSILKLDKIRIIGCDMILYFSIKEL